MLGEFPLRLPVLENVIDKVGEIEPETARRIRTGYFNPQKMLEKIYELHIPSKEDDPWTIIRELAELRAK